MTVTAATPTAATGGTATVTAAAAAARDQGQTRFVTGEAVHLDVRVARLGSRMVARIIDAGCQLALGYAAFVLLQILVGLLAIVGLVAWDSAVAAVTVILTIVIAYIGYPVFLETLTRGRTAGKFIMGLRVVRDDGGPITFRHAFARGLVGVSIEWPGLLGAPVTWVATLWMMIASPQSKRIGDHVAGTVVIHERTPAAWGWVPAMPAGMADWAATLDLAGLDDDLALAVRHFLARNREIREPARTQLGQRLAREVAAVTNPPPPADAPGWAYLAAVHAERHRRAIRQLVAARSRTAAVWPDLSAAVAADTSTARQSPPGSRVAGVPGVPPPRPAHPGDPR